MSRTRDIVVTGSEPFELRPGQRPRAIPVALLPDDKGVPKVGAVHFAQALQIAELGVHVLAVERTAGGCFAAVTSAGAYVVVLSPGDILGSVI